MFVEGGDVVGGGFWIYCVLWCYWLLLYFWNWVDGDGSGWLGGVVLVYVVFGVDGVWFVVYGVCLFVWFWFYCWGLYYGFRGDLLLLFLCLSFVGGYLFCY